MKILQVITSLRIGGAEHVVVHLAKLLRKKGHQIDVVVFDAKQTSFTKELKEAGCKIYPIGHGYYNPLYILTLRKIMKNYDIIHTHNSSPQLFTAIANIGLGKVLITTEHSTNNRKRENPAFAFIDRWMYKRYSKIVTISTIAEEKLYEYLDVGKSDNISITTINNGVDVAEFYNAKSLESLSHEGKFVTVMVAGFREAKDQDTVIKAIASLPNHYELWLVGDGVRRAELESIVKSYQVENRVSFLGIRADVPQILKSADVIIMSSHWEGLSLSNIEGMSSGKPFIASDVNGLREVTKGYGVLFPHKDVSALVDIIRKLHDDKEFYQQTADACYCRALEFDINKMVDEYNHIYESAYKHTK